MKTAPACKKQARVVESEGARGGGQELIEKLLLPKPPYYQTAASGTTELPAIGVQLAASFISVQQIQGMLPVLGVKS